MPVRRTHRKSRNGCLQCKQRHIKCDEIPGTCINCSSSELRCSFSYHNDTPVTTTPSVERSDATTPLPVTPENNAPSAVSNQDNARRGPLDPFEVNLLHLELLHHFQNETLNSVVCNQEEKATAPSHIIITAGLSTPYLMHEILAIAALHLSYLRPAQHSFYRHQAAGLQTRALSLFNSTRTDVDANSCIPIFIFSSLLGVHVLCETVASRDVHFSVFLDTFVNYLNLQRGVKVVTEQSWHFLAGTGLQPMLEIEDAVMRRERGVGRECEKLNLLVESADLGPTTLSAYKTAIEHLQWIFDADRAPSGANSASAFFAWPVLVSVKYTDLLAQRRPEALIVLAHYGVLLHRHRDLWLIGDAGKFLIESITKYLGTHWEKWLVWPNGVLMTASTSEI